MEPEEIPDATFATRIEDFLWSDCDNCRAIRLGFAIGAIVWTTAMFVGVLIVA